MLRYPVSQGFAGRMGVLGSPRLALPVAWGFQQAVLWWEEYGILATENPQCANAFTEKVGTFVVSVRTGRLSPGDTLFLTPEEAKLERDFYVCVGYSPEGMPPPEPDPAASRDLTTPILVGTGILAAGYLLWKVAGY